jgi:2-dehydropantoate 2-reductase
LEIESLKLGILKHRDIRMKHAIVGAGGVGGLMAAALVHVGEEVTLILRPETYAKHADRVRLTSPYGNLDVPVRRATSLDQHFDVVWLTVKATQLDTAIETVSAGKDRFDMLIPLLNGVEHIDRLRKLFGHDRVVPATISVESERIAPGEIAHRSTFVRLAVSSMAKPKLERILKKLSEYGFTCDFSDDEKTMMWRKLVFLAPLALNNSASGRDKGGLMQDPVWHDRLRATVRETGAVATAEGAKVDVDGTIATIEGLPPQMKSSMQKDVEAGRAPELDAIGGPIVRGGQKHNIPTPVTRELVEMIRQKTARG